MNKYIIIRSDNKSISPPMCKDDAIKKIKEYNELGISIYLIYKDINFSLSKNIIS